MLDIFQNMLTLIIENGFSDFNTIYARYGR